MVETCFLRCDQTLVRARMSCRFKTKPLSARTLAGIELG